MINEELYGRALLAFERKQASLRNRPPLPDGQKFFSSRRPEGVSAETYQLRIAVMDLLDTCREITCHTAALSLKISVASAATLLSRMSSDGILHRQRQPLTAARRREDQWHYSKIKKLS